MPLILGASGVRSMRCTPPNAGGALVWAIVVGGAGYFFGSAFAAMIEHAKHYEEIAFIATGAGVLIAVTMRGLRIARLEARAHTEATTVTLQ